ncbi:MAG: hypothetical protein KIT60_29985 [Burkholderiaceae bacterium]|nr:hypothetical protein [Burkholderiaceae bacterium]
MDANFPFAEDDARLRLLYRLPLPTGAGDMLVVGKTDMADLLKAGWTGNCTHAESWRALGGGAAHFDVVATPGLDLDAGDPEEAVGTLRRALSLLRPGGFIVGHMEHSCTLRGLANGRGWRAALHPARFFGRPVGCSLALQGAGFVASAVWYVQPNIQAPMGLIPSEPVAARAEFLRAIRATRGHHSRLGYVLRLALARLGLGGLQQGQLFFWAQRPC